MKVSLIIPCYNEENNINAFFSAATQALEKMCYSYELVFVNDGSCDKTLFKLKELYEKNAERMEIVSFSRNFGKEAAMLAGLKHAKGEYVTIIDADLQQSPQLVVEMVDFLEKHEDYDCVAAYQEQRKESKKMTFLKESFYALINKVCEIEFVSGASDFRTFRKQVVEAIISLPEYSRFSKGIFSWVGFNTYYMPYEVHERNSGESKWSLKKLFKYALEGFISFTTFPLKIATIIGCITSLLAIAYLIIVVIQKLVFSIDIPGYTTIVVLILLLGGIQLLILGIIGEYLARIYLQGKNRPIYIEKECIKRTDIEE